MLILIFLIIDMQSVEEDNILGISVQSEFPGGDLNPPGKQNPLLEQMTGFCHLNRLLSVCLDIFNIPILLVNISSSKRDASK